MRTLLLTLALCLFVLPAQAKYSGGSGTAQDPYQIATAADLIALGETPDDYAKHFLLTADIDLDGKLPGRKVFDKAVIAPDTDANKDGFQGTAFAGVFDGNGHTISHLTIKGGGYAGLFGESWGEIRELGAVHVNITSSGDYVGGLAGWNEGYVTQCYSTGGVSGESSVGGLVGENSGAVTQCYSTGAVAAENDVGGLVGYHYSGHITCCYSTGVVSGGDSVGGLVGRNGELNFLGQRTGAGYVTFCYSTGEVSGTSYVGGLVGSYCRGPVTGCFWDIETSGQSTSGAGTGKTTAEMKTAGTFLMWGTCGNEGFWTIDDGADYPRLRWENKPGKLIEARLSDFLTGQGTQTSPYLIYTLKDLDVIAMVPCEHDKHYRLAFLAGEGTQGNAYLIYTADELNLVGMCPYERDAHFRQMVDIDLSGFDGKQGRPAFNPMASFAGVFDGNSHTISHLTITGASYLGPFGRLEVGAEVRNLGVVDVNITASGGYVGGLVGRNSGTVVHCYNTGTVSGNWSVGGLVGWNDGTLIRCTSNGEINGTHYVGGLAGHNSGTMAECTSTGTAGGTGDCVGGLAGRNTGTVTQCCSSRAVSSSGVNGYVGGLVGLNDNGVVTGCYSTGPASGSQFVGGLVGYNSRGTLTRCYGAGPVSGGNIIGGAVGYNEQGSLTQCYSTGTVSGVPPVGGLVGVNNWADVTQCFWDTQASGQTSSAAGTGKTTREMQTAKTFLDAGWDFVGETANGTEDIWWILEGKDYPRLWWEAQN